MVSGRHLRRNEVVSVSTHGYTSGGDEYKRSHHGRVIPSSQHEVSQNPCDTSQNDEYHIEVGCTNMSGKISGNSVNMSLQRSTIVGLSANCSQGQKQVYEEINSAAGEDQYGRGSINIYCLCSSDHDDKEQ